MMGLFLVETLWFSIRTACCGVVIPAKAGIQVRTFFLDTRLRGCDGRNDSSDTPQHVEG
jgi:hypothetical protein